MGAIGHLTGGGDGSSDVVRFTIIGFEASMAIGGPVDLREDAVGNFFTAGLPHWTAVDFTVLCAGFGSKSTCTPAAVC